MSIRYLPVRVVQLDLESAAFKAGVHPDVLLRFVELGLLESRRDASGTLWFPLSTPSRVQTIRRLHAELSLNYAGIGLVLDLLARIEALENQRFIQLKGERSWI